MFGGEHLEYQNYPGLSGNPSPSLMPHASVMEARFGPSPDPELRTIPHLQAVCALNLWFYLILLLRLLDQIVNCYCVCIALHSFATGLHRRPEKLCEEESKQHQLPQFYRFFGVEQTR